MDIGDNGFKLKSARETIDIVAGGAFLSLTLRDTTTLVEKMASNQSWNKEHVQPHKRGGGMHQLKEVDMLSANMDLLMKKLED
jgi:chorismate synthase